MRFNFYFLTFVPHMLLFILGSFSINTVRITLILAHIPLLSLFFIGLYRSMWTYSVKSEALYLPAFYYIL